MGTILIEIFLVALLREAKIGKFLSRFFYNIILFSKRLQGLFSPPNAQVTHHR